ncbi:response regulator [bacterium]
MSQSGTIHINPKLEKFIAAYIKHRNEDCNTINENLKVGDTENIKHLAHKMRGSGGMYGLGEITRIGQEMEQAAQDKDIQKIEKLNEKLIEYIVKVQQSIDHNKSESTKEKFVNSNSSELNPVKSRILIADDEPDILLVLEQLLRDDGYNVYEASDGLNAFEMIKQIVPDIAILDIDMPGLDGIELKAKLNQDEMTQGIPVLFLTAKDAVKDKVAALELGADDYMTKPFEEEELLARVKAILKKKKMYECISMTDGLTGLHNKDYFKKQIKLFNDIAKRYEKVYSLLIVDMDNLKVINDTFGHFAGDLAIQKIAQILNSELRQSDIIARFGGDEFVIILSECDKENATIVEKKLKSINKNELSIIDKTGKKINFSISVGSSTFSKEVNSEERVFEIADVNMYEDKKSKKRTKSNMITIIDDDEDICNLVKAKLEEKGYEVMCSFDGESGLEVVNSTPPALIILDVMMPKVDGMQVLKNIKKTESTMNIPVLILSAKNQEGDIVQGFKKGAVEYITKPFYPEELIVRIERILGKNTIASSRQ